MSEKWQQANILKSIHDEIKFYIDKKFLHASNPSAFIQSVMSEKMMELRMKYSEIYGEPPQI